VKLLYDFDGDKEVDFVKDKPMQFKSTINQNGAKITLEVRIKVLTSQLEDSLFKIGVGILDAVSHQLAFQVYSEPIKVISKSDQVKQKKGTSKGKNKKLSTDFLSDALSSIEERAQIQTRQLEELIESSEILMSVGGFQMVPPIQTIPDFETSFRTFLSVFGSLSPEAKRQKLQHMSTSSEMVPVAELLQSCWNEGNVRLVQQQQETEAIHHHHQQQEGNKICECVNCPYKRELGRIENYCEDMFALR